MSPKSLFSPSFAVILLSKVKNWKHPKTGFSQLSVRCSREINRYSCRSHKYTNTNIHKFNYKYKPTNTRSSGRCRRIINRRKPLVTQVPVTESESAAQCDTTRQPGRTSSEINQGSGGFPFHCVTLFSFEIPTKSVKTPQQKSTQHLRCNATVIPLSIFWY